MAEGVWIRFTQQAGPVLAALADQYLTDVEESEFEGEDLTYESRQNLADALNEFYALHPGIIRAQAVRNG